MITHVNYGETASYSKIGKAIGTKAYRAVGTVLKKNPLPLIIPCHRVLKKNHNIGGFMGDVKDSWKITLKQNLLKIEGIEL